MKKILFVLFLLVAVKTEAANITVCASGCTNTNAQLQTAINNAAFGDSILLQTGITYTGDFVLKSKVCGPANDTCYVTIRTGVDSTGNLLSTNLFPATDIRITPAYSSVLAKVVPASNNVPAFQTENPPAAVPKYWKLQWLEIVGNTYGGGALIVLGGDDRTIWTTNSLIPDRFIIDQNYIHSRPEIGHHRGIQISSSHTTVTNNYFEDIKSVDEGQVILVTSSPGPTLVQNNFMDGGAETMLVGGSGGCCRQLVIAVQASPAPTSTSARLASVTDLSVSQGVTFLVAGVKQYTEIQSISGLDVTFSPALTVAPDVPGGVNWGLINSDLTVRLNTLTKNVAYRNPIIAAPIGVAASSSTTGGTLAVGTYYYKIVARQNVNDGQVAVSPASTEISSVTTTTTSSINISWNAVPLATAYYIYGRSSGGENIRFSVTPPTTTFTDTGATGTTENVPTGTGTKWQVKNGFELKNCKNCLVEGNIIENIWKMAQVGYVFGMTVITQNSANDSAILKDVTIQKNIGRHANGCVVLSGRDADGFVSSRTLRFKFKDNLCYDIDSNNWGSSERSFLITSGGISLQSPTRMPDSVTIDHNTFNHTAGNANLYLDGFRNTVYQTIPNFIVTNNIFRKGVSYGLIGGNSEGDIASYQGAGSLYDKNIFAGASCGSYPLGTSCPTLAQLDSAIYTNPSTDVYSVQASSVYHNAGTDGKDYGADINAITALTNIAISGNNASVVVYAPVVISTSPTYPGSTAGSTYPSFALQSTGGLAPYSYSLTSGTLPTGVTTSSQGLVTGSTTAAGTFNFRITSTDSQVPPATAFRDYQVVVTEIIFPEPRPDKINYDEGVFFRRATAPDPANGDPVKVGDIWYDLSTNIYKKALSTSPVMVWDVWQPLGTYSKTILFLSNDANTSWTLAAAGAQFSGSNDTLADLTGMKECAVFMRSNQVADGTMWVRYNATVTSDTTAGAGGADLATTAQNPSVSLNSANVMLVGSFFPIVDAAKTFVRLGFWGISASNAVDAAVRNVGMVCR